MKKRYMAVVAMAAGLLMAGFAGPAQATLTVSETVFYEGANRNLIYDDDLMNITWLDYDNYYEGSDLGHNQAVWADELVLTVNGITYGDWRLPTIEELVHLTTSELGNYIDRPDFNTGLFQNLHNANYWSSQEEYGLRYAVNMKSGYYWQYRDWRLDYLPALAVRTGEVSGGGGAPVPEPATMLLLGSGLAGLAGLRRRRRGRWLWCFE